MRTIDPSALTLGRKTLSIETRRRSTPSFRIIKFKPEALPPDERRDTYATTRPSVDDEAARLVPVLALTCTDVSEPGTCAVRELPFSTDLPVPYITTIGGMSPAEAGA
jgi:hypothetical protein